MKSGRIFALIVTLGIQQVKSFDMYTRTSEEKFIALEVRETFIENPSVKLLSLLKQLRDEKNAKVRDFNEKMGQLKS